jgi:hypothetical protein
MSFYPWVKAFGVKAFALFQVFSAVILRPLKKGLLRVLKRA